MKNAQEIIKNADFLSRLLTSNPYTAEGKSILAGLKINLTVKCKSKCNTKQKMGKKNYEKSG